MDNMRTGVIIAAAGMSTRMGTTASKQLSIIDGMSVIEYSLKAFSECSSVIEIVIAAKEADFDEIQKITSKYSKAKRIVKGGNERIDSVRNGFSVISENIDIVAIHDAARPLITTSEIDEIIKECALHGAVCPVGVINDTVKKSDKDGYVEKTLDRNSLFLAHTPQAFKKALYEKALNSISPNAVYTDDASMLEAVGIPVYLHKATNPNVKITRPDDIEIAKFHIGLRKDKRSMRIGHGYDVHKLVEERELILGGVKIPHTHGLLGHSDADVLIHAVMDAIIGALGLGDIGKHFPDTDEKYRGISSMLLLKHTKKLLDENGARVVNADATIIAQSPKLASFIPEMRKNIAYTLGCSENDINVKATTEEGLGFTGNKQGISAHAVVIIEN